MSGTPWEAQAERVAYDETTLLADTHGKAQRAVSTLVRKRKSFSVAYSEDGWRITVEEDNEVRGLAGRWME